MAKSVRSPAGIPSAHRVSAVFRARRSVDECLPFALSLEASRCHIQIDGGRLPVEGEVHGCVAIPAMFGLARARERNGQLGRGDGVRRQSLHSPIIRITAPQSVSWVAVLRRRGRLIMRRASRALG